MAEQQYSKKNVFLLLAGRTVSKFGAAFYLIALPLYILQLTGSLAQTGVFFSLSSLPALLATPFLGVFVEKVNRKYLLVALNFFAANAEEIINPGILVQKYGIPEKLFGMTSSAAVIGTLAAGLFIFRNKWIDLRKNLKTLLLLNSGVMILIGVCSLCMTGFPMAYFGLFLFFEFLLGVITSLVNVPLISSFQTRIPIDYQGRFFALLAFASGLLIPLGISFAGFLASLVGADAAYIINNVCIIVIVLLCRKFV